MLVTRRAAQANNWCGFAAVASGRVTAWHCPGGTPGANTSPVAVIRRHALQQLWHECGRGAPAWPLGNAGLPLALHGALVGLATQGAVVRIWRSGLREWAGWGQGHGSGFSVGAEEVQFRLRGLSLPGLCSLRLPAAFTHLPKPTLVLLAVVCTIHFAVASSVGLSVDEAHYALYAQHLALSYFDHPPLVGWVQWPLVALAAPTAVLRLIPEALWLATALLVYRLGARMQVALSAAGASPWAERNVGAWAVVAFALAPMFHVLGIGLLPDTLLMILSVAVMGLTWDLMDRETAQKPGRWLALGLLLGLAGLSKYTAVFTALAVAWCLWAAHGWRIVRNGWLWLAALLALVVVSPVAVWNYQNQWVSFAYQAQHGAGGGWQGLHFLRFVLVQLVVYGPLMLWAWAGWARTAATPQRNLLAFAVIPFAVFAALSGGGTNLPHWTAPAWGALAPFAGLGLAHAAAQGRRWIIGCCALLQALACVAILGLMVSAGVPLVTQEQGQGNTASPSNPFADVHGWDAAGQRARSLAAQQGLGSVAVQNWTLASRLGWYARPLPVHVLEDRFDQFDLWAGDLPVGGDTLLVDWSQLAYTVPIGAHGFADCTLLDTLPVSRWGAPIARFQFYACHQWSGAPQPQLQGASP